MRKELKKALSSLPTCNPDELFSYPVLYERNESITGSIKRAKTATTGTPNDRNEEALLQKFLETNSFLTSNEGKKILEERSNLPILRCYSTTLEEVAHNTVTIVSGSTGCGKSTQLPQFILDDYMKKKAANLPLPSTHPPHIVIAEVHTALPPQI